MNHVQTLKAVLDAVGAYRYCRSYQSATSTNFKQNYVTSAEAVF